MSAPSRLRLGFGVRFLRGAAALAGFVRAGRGCLGGGFRTRGLAARGLRGSSWRRCLRPGAWRSRPAWRRGLLDQAAWSRRRHAAFARESRRPRFRCRRSAGLIAPDGATPPPASGLLNSRVISAAVCFSGSVIDLRRSVIWSSPVRLVDLALELRAHAADRAETALPSAPSRTGSSLGPMTINATTPITSISVQPTPSMNCP